MGASNRKGPIDAHRTIGETYRRCGSLVRDGSQCKREAIEGSDSCKIHSPGYREAALARAVAVRAEGKSGDLPAGAR